jgi:hypothetical protein
MTALTRNRQDPVEIPYLARQLGCELEYDRRRHAKARSKFTCPTGWKWPGATAWTRSTTNASST